MKGWSDHPPTLSRKRRGPGAKNQSDDNSAPLRKRKGSASVLEFIRLGVNHCVSRREADRPWAHARSDPAESRSAGEMVVCQPDPKNSKWPQAPRWLQNAESVRSPVLKARQSRWKNQCRNDSSRISRKQSAKSFHQRKAELASARPSNFIWLSPERIPTIGRIGLIRPSVLAVPWAEPKANHRARLATLQRA